MTKWLSWFALLAVAGLVGCSKTGTSPANAKGGGTASAGKKLRIAVIPKGTGHQYWRSVEAGAEKAAAETGATIIFKGPTGEGDTAGQIQIVENELADGCDAICLAPLDDTALRKPVQQAIDAKVPVVIFDSGLKDMTGVTCFVATDNKHAGRHAGEFMVKLLGGKGNVIMMRYAINSKSTEDREQGFLDALSKAKGIKLLSANKYGGPNESDAVTLGENLLQDFGGKVNGIFCPNESTASGMLTVLDHDHPQLAGKVKFVGFDSSDNLIGGLKSGHLDGIIVQDPVKMGYDAVKTAVEKLHGQKVPAKIDEPDTLATGKNMHDPKIDALLHPIKAD